MRFAPLVVHFVTIVNLGYLLSTNQYFYNYKNLYLLVFHILVVLTIIMLHIKANILIYMFLKSYLFGIVQININYCHHETLRGNIQKISNVLKKQQLVSI